MKAFGVSLSRPEFLWFKNNSDLRYIPLQLEFDTDQTLLKDFHPKMKTVEVIYQNVTGRFMQNIWMPPLPNSLNNQILADND